MPGAPEIFMDDGSLAAVSLLLKATLMLGMAWILAAAARRSSAAVRHGIWVAALLGVVTLPLTSQWLPPLEIELPEALIALPAGTTAAGSAAPSSSGPIGGELASTTPGGDAVAISTAPGVAEAVAAEPRLDWGEVLLMVWLLGVATRVVWLGAQLARVGRLTRSATPVVDDYRAAAGAEIAALLRIWRRVMLLESRRIATPLTCGLRRPIILIPEDSRDWPDERLRVVLLHELAHIRRWDYVTCLIAEAACAIYWPIPLVWIARRGVHAEQEQASDDLVLASGTAAVDYADHLLAIARTLRGEGRTLSATIGMAREMGLKRRIRTILDGRTRRVPLRSWQGAATLIALSGFALPIAALRPAGAVPELSPPRSPVAFPTAPDSAVLHPAAASSAPKDELYFWLEAENALLRGALELREDLDASLGHYVVVPDDADSGEAVLSLHLFRAGEYRLWGRVMGAAEGDSPFTVSIDNEPAIRLNVARSDGGSDRDWSWAVAGEAGATFVRLGAGIHTVRITNPPGSRLDRILVTTDSAYVPAERGAHPEGFEPDYRWIDVSPATLSVDADFEFDVAEAGSYVLWGRVLGRHGEANSFFLSVDGGPEVIWDAPHRDLGRDEDRWTWDPASAREIGGRNVNPLIFDLAPGRHSVRLRAREEGTGLGGLLVTNDLSYRPRGTPPGTPPVRVWLEPETASPVEALRVRTGGGAMGEGYLEAAERGPDRGRPGDDGTAAVRFELPRPGVYTLWARTVARSGDEDSFWIRVNDGDWVRWNGIPRSREWRWSAVHDGDGDVEPVQFAMPAGENRIEIGRREGGARLDRFLLTNEDHFEPRGAGAE